MAYEKDRADAAKGIKESGYAFAIVKQGTPTTDRQTLKVTASETTFNTFGVELEFAVRDMEGTTVRRGDLKLMVSALTESGDVMDEPKSDDVFRVNGEKDRLIVFVDAFRPGGFALYYFVWVRG